ncbi:hypothetical protein Pmar_PMAR005058 [Perkinsus marinus ATCC 50983]|uniref:Uncharacterized protein n=1 Tax=Perkinsus marinus (strain ATCC 50983 / TXsc) TaxID=423536 RepID=C5LU55_PERM5|nr:hypothetical protein Pmar_PMAR005058 [Perkinsus marinus ATCC 50983]EEQ99737.1 hypothetical protein Pmar_PMAR005058 [Perkinsus marinus ATCC 50983]|eukprot:XP_002767020.1 hypothetical protein Pmar_PMAR005058 [Perkinsus marinus ATCC 50983]
MVRNNIRVAEWIEAFTKARTVLIERYGKDWFAVYGKFQKRRFKLEETPADYLTDLQRV